MQDSVSCRLNSLDALQMLGHKKKGLALPPAPSSRDGMFSDEHPAFIRFSFGKQAPCLVQGFPHMLSCPSAGSIPGMFKGIFNVLKVLFSKNKSDGHRGPLVRINPASNCFKAGNQSICDSGIVGPSTIRVILQKPD